MTVLALDQGTTSTRALVVDGDGSVRVLTSLTHRQSYPRPGWVEHDPEELLANLRACLDAAGADVDAVALANQGESCLGWNAQTGEPVSPVIVWQDDRTEAVTAELRAAGAEAEVRRRAGLPLDPYFSATKLAWILRESDEARRLAAAGLLRLGTTDSFFRDRLTGRFETDVTTASRTSLMNLRTGAWDEALCRLFGVPIDCLPAITASTGDLGEVVCGGRRVPLAASLVDQAASLYGHGCRVAGDTKITFGTGAFALTVVDAPPDTNETGGLLPTVAWRKRGEATAYALDGGVYCASSAVNWARGLGLFADFSEIDGFDGPAAVDRGLVFVPALAGLACPQWDRRARGAWLGMSLDTGRRDLMQALVEGVALRTAQAIAAIERHQPVAGVVSIDGGMSRNGYFCQFLSDVLGREVVVSAEPELTAVGAATLAAEAVGAPIARDRRGRSVSPRVGRPDRLDLFGAACAAVQAFGSL